MRRLAMTLFTAVALMSSLAQAAGLDGKWRLTSLPDVSNFDASKTELAFLPDGRVAMTVGCNRMSATAATGEGTIKFGPIMATKMACLPNLMSLEAMFQNAIGRATTFKRDRDTLTLIDVSSNAVATFSKKD